jgi:hypothetical protein
VIHAGAASEAHALMAVSFGWFVAIKLSLVSLCVQLLWNQRWMRLAAICLVGICMLHGAVVTYHLTAIGSVACRWPSSLLDVLRVAIGGEVSRQSGQHRRFDRYFDPCVPRSRSWASSRALRQCSGSISASNTSAAGRRMRIPPRSSAERGLPPRRRDGAMSCNSGRGGDSSKASR